MFQPQEALDRPCDLTLMVEDDREFKVHKDVLSKASPFFEKLLNSDMKESKEGIIRLDMTNESAMSAILEFIYTGSVQTVVTRELAENLACMADYLFLPNLKSFALRVVGNMETVNASNCISTYHFAELYRCDEILSRTRQFILKNFSAVAKTDEFLNLSNKEVEMWISSDEIDVSAEENVFEIILEWIARDENERKKFFTELFREVRLVYVSRDFLSSTIATNCHVKANGGCLDLVEGALKVIDSNNFDDLPTPPRKTPTIAVCNGEHLFCYFPREDRLCKVDDISISRQRTQIASICHDQLYSFTPSIFGRSEVILPQVRRYDMFSNILTPLPYSGDGALNKIVVRNGCEIYGLVYNRKYRRCPDCNRGLLFSTCLTQWFSCYDCRRTFTYHKEDLGNFVISRYVPESNVWKEIASFDSPLRKRVCLVANDNFIYVIGGGVHGNISMYLSDVDRCDLNQNTCEKVADMREARMLPCGAAAHGKIFIAGGNKGASETCEVYNERSNEWQFIGSLVTRRALFCSMVCCDGNLYVLGGCYGSNCEGATVERYDFDNDKWIKTTTIPFHQNENADCGFVSACSMGISKKCLSYIVLDSASVGVAKHLTKRGSLQ